MTIIDRMSIELRLDPRRVFEVVQSASRRYRRIALERPNREPRIIWQPAPELRLLQTWCAVQVLNRLPVHTSCYSYVKGRSIVGNAQVHATSAFITRLDIEAFFPSLHASPIRNFLLLQAERLGLTDAEIDILVSLITRKNEVPIGAPTSPAISNALLYSFDIAAQNLANNAGAKYTRYADDIYLSSDEPNILARIEPSIRALIAELPGLNLRVNEAKTSRMSKRGRRKVTGLIVTPQGTISLGRKAKRSIRTKVFLALNGTVGTKQLRSLIGHIANAQSAEPDFVVSLAKKFGPNFLFELRQRMRQGELLG